MDVVHVASEGEPAGRESSDPAASAGATANVRSLLRFAFPGKALCPVDRTATVSLAPSSCPEPGDISPRRIYRSHELTFRRRNDLPAACHTDPPGFVPSNGDGSNGRSYGSSFSELPTLSVLSGTSPDDRFGVL